MRGEWALYTPTVTEIAGKKEFIDQLLEINREERWGSIS